MPITTLDQDLSSLLGREWKSNAKVTPAQAARYPQSGKISRDQLGIDKNGGGLYLLPEYANNGEAGFDGKPVFSVGDRTVKGFFWDNENHEWAQPGDLLRFGLFMHLDPYRTIHLMVKSAWERFFWDVLTARREDDPESLLHSLKSEDLARKYSKQFIGDTAPCHEKFQINVAEWRECLDMHGEICAKLGYKIQKIKKDGLEQEVDTFELLISRMVQSFMHLKANNSRELQLFAEKEREKFAELEQVSEELSERHWMLNCQWNELGVEEGNWLEKLENQRLANENVKQQWHVKYGRGYILFLNADHVSKCLNRRLDLVELDPDMTMEDIFREEEKARAKEEEELKAMKMEIELNRSIWPGLGKTLTGDELIDYTNECKKLLRQIWRLTHPDRITDSDLTDEQKKKLRMYFDQATEINNSAKYYDVLMQVPRENLGFTLLQLQKLQEILSRVKMIYANMGIDIPEDSIVQGDTIEEQCDWLLNRIEGLEKSIESIKNEYLVLNSDQNIREMQAALQSDAQIESLRQEMTGKISELLNTIEDLIKALEKRLGRAGWEDFTDMLQGFRPTLDALQKPGGWE